MFALDALKKNKWLVKSQETGGQEDFLMVLAFTPAPFALSGYVTLAGAKNKKKQ